MPSGLAHKFGIDADAIIHHCQYNKIHHLWHILIRYTLYRWYWPIYHRHWSIESNYNIALLSSNECLATYNEREICFICFSNGVIFLNNFLHMVWSHAQRWQVFISIIAIFLTRKQLDLLCYISARDGGRGMWLSAHLSLMW